MRKSMPLSAELSIKTANKGEEQAWLFPITLINKFLLHCYNNLLVIFMVNGFIYLQMFQKNVKMFFIMSFTVTSFTFCLSATNCPKCKTAFNVKTLH